MYVRVHVPVRCIIEKVYYTCNLVLVDVNQRRFSSLSGVQFVRLDAGHLLRVEGLSFRASLDAAASERVALDELLGIFVSEVE